MRLFRSLVRFRVNSRLLDAIIPLLFMRRTLASAVLFSTLLVPASSFALEGIGPRATVVGEVKTVTITEKQKFEEQGGEYTMTAQNGQTITVILTKDTKIISEGKTSRKQLLPVNITPDMYVRVRGWKNGSDSLTASLIVILNLELNPTLAVSGVIQSIDSDKVTLLTQDATSRTFTINTGTEVNINYKLYGPQALSFIGKEAFITLNPYDPTNVRVLRIQGNPEPERNKPSTLDLRMR